VLIATMQLGFRNEHSEVQRAKFQLMQRAIALEENETRITFELTQIIRTGHRNASNH
jgi:hypothetical protein